MMNKNDIQDEPADQAQMRNRMIHVGDLDARQAQAPGGKRRPTGKNGLRPNGSEQLVTMQDEI